MPRRLDLLQDMLGFNSSRILIVSGILFAIAIPFYTLTVGSILQPTIYPLLDRVTYSTPFVDKYFFGKDSDSITVIVSTLLWIKFALIKNTRYLLIFSYGFLFALAVAYGNEPVKQGCIMASVPLICFLAFLGKTSKLSVYFSLRLVINYLAAFGLILGILGATTIAFSIMLPNILLPSINYLYYFYLLFSILAPIFFIIISLGLPLKFITHQTLSKIKHFYLNGVHEKQINQDYFLIPRLRLTLLGLIITLSILISLIPHIEFINSQSQLIGSDTLDYSKMIQSMLESSTATDFFNQVFVVQMGGDRPFSLLLFFEVSQILNVNNIPLFLDFLPVFLGPLLILCIYFLTVQITKNHVTSLLACLFTIPFHLLIGMYGGLYANLFSLSFGYLSILFLFRSLDNFTKRNLFWFSLLLVVLLFTHTPTWTIFVYAISLFMTILFVKRSYEKRKLLMVFLSLLPSVFIDIIKMIIINKSGVLQEINFASSRVVGFQDVYTIWGNLVDTSHLYMAGLLGNPIILILVLMWLINYSNRHNYSMLIMVFFSMSILPILFGEQEIQTRFYYEIPFQIPAAIALTVILKRYGFLPILSICFSMIVISIRAASNFHLILK